MRILTFTGFYLPGYKGGGPIKTIRNLFDSTGDDGIEYQLVTADRDLGDTESFASVKIGEWNQVGNAMVFYAAAGNTGLKQIRHIIAQKDYQVIYLNSFFSFRFSIYPQLLAWLNRQTVIVGPRGEFSDGAVKIKAYKKRFFVFLYKLFNLHQRVIFQASSEYEAKDIQRVLGNNVCIKIAENIGAQEFAKNIPSKFESEIRIIFVSRISPKKNLLMAIQMLNSVKTNVVFDIYGPIEDKDYWAKCENAIKELPPYVEVRHKGSLTPEQVVSKMSVYDMFFMPTLGENYGHVIAEAFCAGLPALIADTTPWRQLEEKGIGWDIPLNDPARFAQTIDEFSQISEDEYIAKREHILNWAKHKFSQRDAIDANIAMFKYAYEKSRKQ